MTALTQALAAELVAAQGTSIVIPSTYTSIEDLAFFSMFALTVLKSQIVLLASATSRLRATT